MKGVHYPIGEDENQWKNEVLRLAKMGPKPPVLDNLRDEIATGIDVVTPTWRVAGTSDESEFQKAMAAPFPTPVGRPKRAGFLHLFRIEPGKDDFSRTLGD